jgi:hypothetical protein
VEAAFESSTFSPRIERPHNFFNGGQHAPIRSFACVATFSTCEVEGEPTRRSFRSASLRLAPFAVTRLPLVAPLELEMGILGENPQDLEWALREPFNHFVSIDFLFWECL